MFGKTLVAFSLLSLAAAAAPVPLPYFVDEAQQPAPAVAPAAQPAASSEPPAPAAPAVISVPAAVAPAAPPAPLATSGRVPPPAPSAVPPAPAAQAPVPKPAPTPAPPAAPRQSPAPAETPRPVPEPPDVPRAPAARRQGQLANVRVDVSISDQGGSGPVSVRTISATAADGERAAVRNAASVRVGGSYQPTELSLDIRPQLDGGRVRLEVGLEFQLLDTYGGPAESGDKTPAFGKVRLTQNVVLESGQPLMISQSTAPGTERKVSVEVKATVLK